MQQSTSHHSTRDYAGLVSRARQALPADPPGDSAQQRHSRMLCAADLAWEALASRGISWIGFYLKDPVDDHLILGPRRDKPACSPIGLHGMCGLAFLERRPVVVRDVAALGGSYIACDPRDRSEVVIPLFTAAGECWGVLDADSYDAGAFDQRDVDGLTNFVEALELSAPPAARPLTLHR